MSTAAAVPEKGTVQCDKVNMPVANVFFSSPLHAWEARPPHEGLLLLSMIRSPVSLHCLPLPKDRLEEGGKIPCTSVE
jgi:hypothetical protein